MSVVMNIYINVGMTLELECVLVRIQSTAKRVYNSEFNQQSKKYICHNVSNDCKYSECAHLVHFFRNFCLSRGGNSKSFEVKNEGIRVLHNYRPSVATDSFRYLRRIPSLGIFLLLLPLAHLQ